VTSRGDAIAARARALVGTPYRPKGRTRDGLDCAGLAAIAFGFPPAAVPRGYGRRSTGLDLLAAQLERLGLAPAGAESPAPGDLLVFRTGLGQLHLGIATGTGFVHADAGSLRAVERPFPPPWPIAAVWRLEFRQKAEPDPWQHSS